MTTIKDVAKLAGVSTATVSRVLSNPEIVSTDTRNKILSTIEETGYVTNTLARNLRSQKSYSVLVLVPNIANPFFAEILQGIELVAHQNKYRILFGDTQYDEERESAYAELVLNKQADGVISLGRAMPSFTESIKKRNINLPIVMGCEFGEKDGPTTVCIDNAQAAFEACEHLIELGHKNIAFINGPKQSAISSERLSGYLKALNKHKLPHNDKAIVYGDFTMESGKTCVQKLIEENDAFSALFTANDEMAIGAIQGLSENNLSVPEDVSVVGFDDIPFAAFCTPTLTTIRQPRQAMGTKLMEILLAQINGEPSELTSKGRVILPHSLVKRDSSRSNKA